MACCELPILAQILVGGTGGAVLLIGPVASLYGKMTKGRRACRKAKPEDGTAHLPASGLAPNNEARDDSLPAGAKR